MASSLDSLVGHNIMVVTTDGRCFHGTLKGFDQTINLILDQSHERVYSAAEGKLCLSYLFPSQSMNLCFDSNNSTH